MTIIGTCLLLVVTLFPFPMSAQRLSSTRWCAASIRDAHFQFDQSGGFYYGAMVVDNVGGASAYEGQGKWERRGTSIYVVDDGGYSFTIRPLLFGYMLWSTVDFGGAIILLPIWRAC